MARRIKETAKQRQAAGDRLTAFLEIQGATYNPQGWYDWRLDTPCGPLDVQADTDALYGCVFACFAVAPSGELPNALMGNYPPVNHYSGKWNFHAETITEAVDWFIEAVTTLRGAAL